MVLNVKFNNIHSIVENCSIFYHYCLKIALKTLFSRNFYFSLHRNEVRKSMPKLLKTNEKTIAKRIHLNVLVKYFITACYNLIITILRGMNDMAKPTYIIDQRLLELDAVTIAGKIRNKELTSEEITRTLIEHVKRVNGALNAVVEDRFEAAIEEAKEKDRNIDGIDFDQQPLYGVPISIKESFHVKGMKTTGGIVHRKDLIMTEDAEVVKRLKRAGAIIIAKTNTPSLCFCQETDNKLYGRTNNAWDPKRTAGGSSGGEAALIAVGGSPVGMSSDIGGSIRFPSHFNGVVGFKPGKFQVSTEGHFPDFSHPLQQRMSSIGPIGKSVQDVKQVYEIVAKHKQTKRLYEKMQIDILPNDNGYPLSNEIGEKLEEIYTFLSEDYETDWAIPPYFNDSTLLWQEIMSIDGAKEIKELAFNKDRVNLYKEYSKEKLTQKTDTHEYLTWALIGANLFKPTIKRVREIEAIIKRGDRILESHFKNRILILPVYHRTALKHGDLFKEIFSLKKTFLKYLPYITYANVWGLPSLTVPVGFDRNRLPYAIQLISTNGNEQALFAIGEKIEKHFGGYRRSTIYD